MGFERKMYEIDFDKVKTVDDIKNILAQMDIRFTDTAGVDWKNRPITHLLKLSNKS